jgi:hypothetical protein
MTRQSATIGDALIFMTKAALLCVVLLIGAWLWIVIKSGNQDRVEQALKSAHAQVLTHQDTIAELGNKLNMCIVRLAEQTGDQPRWQTAPLADPE